MSMMTFSRPAASKSGLGKCGVREVRSQLRGLWSNLALSDATLLINLSNESHLPCIGVPHNDDFVVAFTKLDEPLPRTDRCLVGEAIACVVAAVRNVDFSHQHPPPCYTYTR